MERKAAAGRSKTASYRYWPVLLLLVALLIAGSASGAFFARYITTNQQQVAMISAGFHLSSNLLETDGVSNLGGTDKVVIELYNFEKENNAQVSAVDITYTIAVIHGAVVSVNEGSSAVPGTEIDKVRYYTLSAGPDRVTHTITIAPDHAGDVTVQVASTAPFTKTLTGSFTFADPVYTIERVEGDLYKLTVYTNGFNGEIGIAMTGGVFADKTVDLEQSWTGASNTLTVQDNETYELRFFGSITETGSPVTLTGANKTIQVGN